MEKATSRPRVDLRGLFSSRFLSHMELRCMEPFYFMFCNIYERGRDIKGETEGFGFIVAPSPTSISNSPVALSRKSIQLSDSIVQTSIKDALAESSTPTM